MSTLRAHRDDILKALTLSLIVYVERVTTLVKQTVGTSYEGFSAKVVKSGKIHPAGR